MSMAGCRRYGLHGGDGQAAGTSQAAHRVVDNRWPGPQGNSIHGLHPPTGITARRRLAGSMMVSVQCRWRWPSVIPPGGAGFSIIEPSICVGCG